MMLENFVTLMPNTIKSGTKRLVDVWERSLAAEGITLTTAGLIAALENSCLDIRAGAALILGRRDNLIAIPYLSPLLKDENPVVRVEAAMSLALLGNKSGIPVLIEALEESRFIGAAVTAAGYLATLGDPHGYYVVLKALRSKLTSTRLMAAVILRDFMVYHRQKVGGHKLDLFLTVKKALKDREPLVRRELLYTLAALDDKRINALMSMVHWSDSNERVRQTAVQIMQSYSTKTCRTICS